VRKFFAAPGLAGACLTVCGGRHPAAASTPGVGLAARRSLMFRVCRDRLFPPGRVPEPESPRLPGLPAADRSGELIGAWVSRAGLPGVWEPNGPAKLRQGALPLPWLLDGGDSPLARSLVDPLAFNVADQLPPFICPQCR